jgi:hypothetical protein
MCSSERLLLNKIRSLDFDASHYSAGRKDFFKLELVNSNGKFVNEKISFSLE